MRLLFVFGTRPEAIKLAPVIRELSARPEFDCKICVTGQHRELLGRFLDLFELRPDWNLDVMRPDQGLAYLTGAVLSGVSGVIERWRPERVIVQGDTTSTFAGALAAFYHQIPVAHVEAGLRTGDLYAPWPEEANRLLVARLADLHFAPTARARDNLLREGVAEARIAVTGNTGIDALLWVSERLETRPDLGARAAAVLGPDGAESFAGRRLILMTGHRRESFDGGIERIARAMARIAQRPDVAIVFPVHPNPNVRRAIEPLRRHDNIRLIEPVDYPELVYLLKAVPLRRHRFRRHSGRGALVRQAGAGDARGDRTAGSDGTGAGEARGHRRRAAGRGVGRAPRRPPRLPEHEPSRQSLWRRPGQPTHRRAARRPRPRRASLGRRRPGGPRGSRREQVSGRGKRRLCPDFPLTLGRARRTRPRSPPRLRATTGPARSARCAG